MANSFILWSGVSVSLLIIAVLLFPGGRPVPTANRYLSALVCVLLLRLAIQFLFHSGFFEAPNFLVSVGINISLFLGPCLYFYTSSLTGVKLATGWRFLWHWLLALVGVLVSLWLYDGYVSGHYLHQEGSQPELKLAFLAGHAAPFVSVLAYGGASLVLLWRHWSRIREEFSNLNRINLSWLAWLCGLLILAALSLLIHNPEEQYYPAWHTVLNTLTVYYIGFMGIRQPVIFSQTADDSDERQPISVQQGGERKLEDTSRQPLPLENTDPKLPIDSDTIWQSLQQLLEQEQPFRRPNLNLVRLAELIEVPPYRLSAVINHHGQCSFFDLINQRRVEYAKRLLLDESCSFSVLEISMESGFNSKSTFYSQFKKITGVTPTEFRASGAQG